ncbi:MAG: hypothetical protein IKG56_02560 [Clostridia bacterium]|nr:hypothetical protein [Clostridia bacterium]
MERTKDARRKNEEAQVRERIELAYHSALIKDSKEKRNQLTNRTLQEELENEFKDKTVNITPNEDNTQWIISVDNVDVTVEAGITILLKDKNGLKIASTNETTPWIPTSNTEITNNDLSKGLTIKDDNENEWVWIEVPKSLISGANTDEEIKAALENYLYEQNAKGESTPLITIGKTSSSNKTTTKGFIDTNHNGTGLTDEQYSEKYSKMLRSIQENGGFYIGKYEVGYEDTNHRTKSNKENTTNIPVIKADAYPYNWVTNEQAERLSETLTTGMASTTDEKAGLLFGIQWDLVLKYLSEKGVLSKSNITSNSQEWGNFKGEFSLNQTTTHGHKGTLSTDSLKTIYWEPITSSYTHPDDLDVLSAGATERNGKLNIYDLSGNMFEWTLENTSRETIPCVDRGGSFSYTGSGTPVSYRDNLSPTASYHDVGFRATLF